MQLQQEINQYFDSPNIAILKLKVALLILLSKYFYHSKIRDCNYYLNIHFIKSGYIFNN